VKTKEVGDAEQNSLESLSELLPESSAVTSPQMCVQDKGSAARQMSHKVYLAAANLVSMILLDHIE
jgi:hypothetical protein